jgi:C4-dicarboxylate-specific signal transduction histidine kinase
VLGVIDFLSRDVRQPDQELLEMMASLGSQIGQFIERKRAEDAPRVAQSEVTHLARVMTMGELTASIAHEVNQPLLGMVTSASSCARWLAAQPPNLERAQRALERIVTAGPARAP